MPSDFFEIDCDGEVVIIERTDDGKLLFHNWDMDAELAAIELGFEPSLCFHIWNVAAQDQLDHRLSEVAFDENIVLVEALLFAGADPWAYRNAALRRAKYWGQRKVQKLLEQHMGLPHDDQLI
jgi:hypothetical protein